VRVILASNQALEALVQGGQFRQDLYYRINVVKIELSPLRERVGDIEQLALFFLEKYGEDLKRQLVGYTREAMDALRRYSYPGNVRELQNIVERACVLARGQTIELTDLPEHVCGRGAPLLRPRAAMHEEADAAWSPMTLEDALREPERRVLLRALRANNWNRQKTSEQLGINRTTLYKKMKALDIPAHDSGEDARLAG
jgi:DNA-binding NtrC family response regulator